MNGLRSLKKAVLVALCGGAFAVAGSICPGATTGTTFTHPPDPTATGCNVVITVPASGSISVVVTDAIPYESSEDVLIGVVNNSGTALGSLNLSGSGIFGFEGDGVCTFTFPGSSYCSGTYYQSDPGDYAGPGVTFTNFASLNSGTVNFSPAVAANGGKAYFSLEGVPTANLVVTTGGGGGSPAPPSLVLLLAALACMGLYFAFRKPATN